LNTDSDKADVASLGRLFHTFASATGKARAPTVDRRQVGTSSVVVASLSAQRVIGPFSCLLCGSETELNWASVDPVSSVPVITDGMR